MSHLNGTNTGSGLAKVDGRFCAGVDYYYHCFPCRKGVCWGQREMTVYFEAPWP